MGVELSNFVRPIDAPARGAFAVTKSDSTVFDNEGSNPPPTRSLYIGGAGDVAVRMIDGSTVVFVGCTPGLVLPICVDKVLATGTTATSILGLY